MLRLALLSLLCLSAPLANAKRRSHKLPNWVDPRPFHEIEEDDSKIVGGTEVDLGERPFQLSFQTDQYGYWFHFCGAIAYNENYAITAAHCCDGQNLDRYNLRVAGGLLSVDALTQEEVPRPGVQSPVLSLDIHEAYGDLSNDICIIVMAGLPIDDPSVDDGNRIKPVPLPDQGTQYTSGPAVVSGWGTLESGGSSPDELMAVEVPIVGDDECNADYRPYGGIDPDTMICAGVKGKDSCQGDSGGPMTCEGNLCGIVSWGVGCALDGYPGVYTEAANYVDWIREHTRD